MGNDEKEVKISKAKGRPMLTWVGKRPLSRVKSYPAQHVESFSVPVPAGATADCDWSDWPEKFPRGGLLFHGDNKDVLAHLLANGFRGKVKLIYIDPPFDSGADYVRKVQLRGAKGSTTVDGEEYTLGEQVQYEDIWANDSYLQFMFERLLMLRELLDESGSIYLHCDDRKNHYLRCLMDEVFGADNYKNEIVWKRTTARSGTSTFNHIHDTIIFYSKGSAFTWNQQYLPYSDEYISSNFKRDQTGRLFRESPITAPGLRSGPSGAMWKGLDPSTIGKGRHWAVPSFLKHLLSPDAIANPLRALDELERIGRIRWAKDGEGRPNAIQYVDDLQGVELQSLWIEFGAVTSNAAEAEDYPTQKPEELLNRIIMGSSKANDIVLDCFLGSGTSCAVAQRLGRRWIGCDINKGAIQTTSKRLQTLIQEQAARANEPKQEKLDGDPNAPPKPCQFSFTTWRVNDYDLQIQHNEAVALACEHIGVTRTRADGYFDGTLGNRLVKIVPFNHPLTPLDLEDLRAELKRRPEEERDITLVALGLELSAKAWIEDYNRNRPVNRLHLIELRTDRKYGGFIKHEPLVASVTLTRQKDRLLVAINDVFSPGILQRLNLEEGIFRAQIDDWRAVVDCIMIDTDYNGTVFNVALSDVPTRKQDYVAGQYELAAPRKGAMVAVKIVDMLGEECLIAEAAP